MIRFVVDPPDPGQVARIVPRLGAAALAIAAALTALTAGPEGPGLAVRIQRTWMPEAHPSSFAVGLPNGLSCCFDPQRGQVIYAWTGGFVDLAPTLALKFPRDATIEGHVFFRATEPAFRGRSGAPATVRFLGHALRHGYPEFHYEVGGVRVWQTVRPAPDGRPGLVCRYRVDATAGAVLFQPPVGSRLNVEQGAPSPSPGEPLPLEKTWLTFTESFDAP